MMTAQDQTSGIVDGGVTLPLDGGLLSAQNGLVAPSIIIAGTTASGTGAELSGAELDTLQSDSALTSIVITDNLPVSMTVAQLTSDAAAIGKLHNADSSTVALALTDTSINFSAGAPAAASGKRIDLASPGTTAILYAGMQVGVLAAGDVISGSSLTITGGAVGTLTVSGGGDSVSLATGAVTIGGNGQTASNANNDTVSFSGAGTGQELDNSRADFTGNGLTLSAGTNDTMGVIGSAETVTATGAGDVLWVGGNGWGASNANNDLVTFSQIGGTGWALSNSRVDFTGAGLTLYAQANDTLGVVGRGDTVTAVGSGDTLWVGGNGQNALNVADDLVTFDQPGVGWALNNSRVDFTGSYLRLYAQTNDTMGVTGSGDTVSVGSGDVVWVGGNGQNASNANNDLVTFAPSVATPSIGWELSNSRVDFTGNAGALYAQTNDTMGVTGNAIVTAIGTGDVIWIGGGSASANNWYPGDQVTFDSGGVGWALNNSDVGFYGVAATIYVQNNDTAMITVISGTVNVLGNTNYVHLNAEADTINVYGGGNSIEVGGNDVRTQFGTFNPASNANNIVVNFSQSASVTVDNDSRTDLYGGNLNIQVGSNDLMGITGNSETVTLGRGRGDGASTLWIYGTGDHINFDDSYGDVSGILYLPDNIGSGLGPGAAAVTVSGGASTIHAGGHDDVNSFHLTADTTTPQPGYLMDQRDMIDWSGGNGAGAESTLVVFPASGGNLAVLTDYSGFDGAGTVLDTLTDIAGTTGGSQYMAVNPVSGVTAATLTYSATLSTNGYNATGLLSSATATLASGITANITYSYASGVYAGATESDYSGGVLKGTVTYNAHNVVTATTGGDTNNLGGLLTWSQGVAAKVAAGLTIDLPNNAAPSASVQLMAQSMAAISDVGATASAVSRDNATNTSPTLAINPAGS